MSAPGFHVRVGRTGETVVIAPSGELDIATSPDLAEALAAAGSRDVVLDLRGLEFIDSSGVAGVVEAWRRAGESGGRLRVVEGPPEIQRVLTLVALDRELEWTEAPADVTWLDGNA